MIQKSCRVILWIGSSVQIVLGICWMLMNFPHFQMFDESNLYVEISRNLMCDEYEGILYPLFILLAKGIVEIFPIPYYCILYLLQLVVALTAGYVLLRTVGVTDVRRLVWGDLVLLTFPMAMQCHLAVLPRSLVCSFFLLELAFCLQAMQEGRCQHTFSFVKVLFCWMITALLQPEYLYLGVVPVLILFGYRVVKTWKNNRTGMLRSILVLMAFAGMIMGVHSLTQTEGYYGRTRQSLNLHLASRCVWRYVHADYESWPEDAKTLFTPQMARSADFYPDNVERIVGRTLEDFLGVKRAREVLGDIAKHAWTCHKQKIVHDTMWDLVGYAFSPPVIQRQFEGKAYDSYSGANYDVMRMKTPVLSEKFFNYGCWWFGTGLIVAGVLQISVLFRAKVVFWSVKKIIVLSGWLITVSAIAVYYSLQGAGVMDYKKSIVVNLLWLTWMLTVGTEKSCKGEEIC